MPTYNFFYLPNDIWATPQTIFSIASIRERSLYNAVRHSVERELELSKFDLEQVGQFSHLAAEFIAAGWFSDRETQYALPTAALRFDTLLEDYANLAGKLEPTLMDDNESLERLIMYFRKAQRGGLFPESHYVNLLRRDPDRYLRLEPNASPEVIDALLTDTIAKKHQTPEHAFYYMVIKRLQSVDGELLNAIKRSDEHAYLAALHMQQEGAPAEVYSTLVRGITSPRWIYHALKDGLLIDDEATLKKLCRHPGWAVEWVMRKRAPIEEVEQVYLQCKWAAPAHPCQHDLDLWFKRRVIRMAATFTSTTAVA